MTRFFLERVEGTYVRLNREDAHHLLRVLRAQIGDRFTVLSEGVEYECRLETVDDGCVSGRILTSAPATGEPLVHITLFQGLAKGDKVELVIQHGTEIGVSEFVPVSTSRSVVKLEPKKAIERVERWQRIAREAAEQSRRGAIPKVAAVVSWQEVLTRCSEFDLALVPWEEGGEKLPDVLAELPAAQRVAIFIGPEGGLTAEEVTLARENGARTVTLGPRILRTETAGLVAATVVLYTLEMSAQGKSGGVK